VKQAPSCKISELENQVQEEESDMDIVPPSAPKRKRKRNGKAPIVEQEVRRSLRIMVLNEGFKNHSSCSDKNFYIATLFHTLHKE
jgi:hypothetical protein